jgi:hypothetical protein
MEAARSGTDWCGVSIFRQAILETTIERSRQAGPFPNEYDGATGTFADACRKADAEYCKQQERFACKRIRDIPRLAKSTIAAVDYLLKQDDPHRLRDFIANHPASEAGEVIAHAKERKLCR